MRERSRALSRFCGAALVLTLAFTQYAPAGTSSTALTSADARTFVTLHVNTLDEGETIALLRGHDVLLPVSALEQAGVHGFGGRRERLQQQQYVSLASLAPDVHFTLDADALVVNVTVAPKHLASMKLDLNAARPAHVQYTSVPSVFANYAFDMASGGSSSAFLELGQSSGATRIDSSFTAQAGAPVRRGLTYVENDDRIDSVRRVAGDFLTSSGDLGGSAFIAGYAQSRAFDLDPYAVHYALPSLAGAVTTPSTADVYVNGVLVRRVPLPPGTFDLSNLPVTTGSANTQVVLTDAFGHSQTLSQQYYASADVLAPGVTDFQYAAGLLRRNAFQYGDAYGPAAVSARYRVGLSGSVTAGARFEGTPNLFSGGASVDVRLPVGSVHLAAAAGSDAGKAGSAASAAYQYVSPRFDAGASLLLENPNYATLSQPLSVDRALSSLSAFAGVQLLRGLTAQVNVFRRVMRDSGTENQLAFSQTVPLDRRIALTLSEEHDTYSTRAPGNAISVVANFSTGRLDVASTVQRGTDNQQTVQLSQSPPGRYGLGYVASVSPLSNAGLNGTFYYRSHYGDYSLDYGAQSGSAFSDALRVNGGVAFIDGGVYAAPPITGSYALVEVPNTPGVRVYFQNQDVGKTDRRGRLFVADLLPNYGNELRIDDSGAPLDTSIDAVQQLIAPPVRGGAVARFAATRVHAIHGKLRVRRGDALIVPSYGQLTIKNDAGDDLSIVGASGEFYFENLAPGAYAATVLFAHGTCEFTLHVPAVRDVLDDMGTLTCDTP